MKTVFLFVPDLNGGGAERALVNILKCKSAFEKLGFSPVLVVRRWVGAYVNDIPADINRVVLGGNRSGLIATVLTVFRLGAALRRYRPSVVVSFLSAPSVFLAVKLFFPSSLFGLSVQTSPNQWANTENSKYSNLIKKIQGIVFRAADFLLPISTGIAEELQSVYSVSPAKCCVVYNSIDSQLIKDSMIGPLPADIAVPAGTIVVVTAGRIVRQKNQEILIQALSEVLRHGRKARLYILGEGPEEPRLRRMTVDLGISDCVRFLGFQKNPWIYFKYANIFALSSCYEGFANVLVEAMACGLPILSTDAPHGPNEILDGGKFGLIVPVSDSGAFAHKLLELIDSAQIRNNYSALSFQRARDFDSEVISEHFWAAIQSFSIVS